MEEEKFFPVKGLMSAGGSPGSDGWHGKTYRACLLLCNSKWLKLHCRMALFIPNIYYIVLVQSV